jgi:hypothetical protein
VRKAKKTTAARFAPEIKCGLAPKQIFSNSTSFNALERRIAKTCKNNKTTDHNNYSSWSDSNSLSPYSLYYLTSILLLHTALY